MPSKFGPWKHFIKASGASQGSKCPRISAKRVCVAPLPIRNLGSAALFYSACGKGNNLRSQTFAKALLQDVQHCGI